MTELSNKPKVIVIGLDGGEPSLIFKWAKEGKLPNIAKLIENGVSGKLRSTIPPITAPAWTSFMTGRNPGKHGIFFFINRKFGKSENELVNSSLIKGEFWNEIGRFRKIGLLNVPLTYPPKKVNGFVVSGYTTPTEQVEFTHPKEIKELLLKKFNYRINDSEYLRTYGTFKEYLEDLHKVLDVQEQALKYLIKNREWDFFMYVFQGVDHVQHIFWKFMDKNHPLYYKSEPELELAIENYLKRVDKIIGDLLGYFKDVNVFIISDHGFRGCFKIFYFNEWMKSEGFLNIGKKNVLLRLGLIKNIILERLNRIKLPRMVIRLTPQKIKNMIPDEYSCINLEKTKAYCVGSFGQIFINVKSKIEYEQIRKLLIDKLESVKDPITGERVVERVYKKEEIYFGHYLDNAPDLTVWLRNGYIGGGFSKKGEIVGITPFRGTGQHDLEGIFIASGLEIKKNEVINNVEIIDIAPTILHIFGIPIPKDMDGRVLKEIFEEDSKLAKREIIYDTEEEQIRRRIKELKSKGRI